MNELEVRHQEEVRHVLDQAKGFIIKTAEDFALVDAHCAGLLALKKDIEKDFKASKESAYSTWKAIVAQEKGHLDGIDEARRIDKQKMDAWREEQETIRRREEARLQEEARRRAEQEQLEAAERAEKSGNKAEAEEILNERTQVPTIIVTTAVPKSKTVIRKIVDQAKIAQAVANGTRTIPGVSVYQVWTYQVVNPSLVPDEFKRTA